jgi:multiple sugar transport system permease protein
MRRPSVPAPATPGARSEASAPDTLRRRTARALRQLVPALVAILFVLPVFWMVTASLRAPGLPPPRSIEWIPDPASLEAYVRLFELLPFARYLLNSLVVVALAVPITIVTASMAGFAMSQLERQARSRLVVLSVAMLMIPVTALWLTRFLLFRTVGLVDSLGALIIPAFMGSSPLFVLIYYWTFRQVPAALVETARLEGAGPVTIWRRIFMPLAAPSTVAVAVLAFLLYWSDFISPLLYLRSQDLYTLPLGLRQLQQLDPSDWPLLMAGAVLLTAPAVALFVVVQRRFLGEARLTGIPTD